MEGVVTDAEKPSPKSQAQLPIGGPPGEITVASVNVTNWPRQAVSVLMVNPAVGLLYTTIYPVLISVSEKAPFVTVRVTVYTPGIV